MGLFEFFEDALDTVGNAITSIPDALADLSEGDISTLLGIPVEAVRKLLKK